MKPWFTEVIKLSPDYPPDLVVYRIEGSLARPHLDDFFRRLAVHIAGFRTVILDMAGLTDFGHAAFDRFLALSRELALRDRQLVLTGLPQLLFDHQIKTAMGQKEIRFHGTLEEALAALSGGGSAPAAGR